MMFHKSKGSQNEETLKKENTQNNQSEDALIECQKKGEEYLNGWKRAQADYENLKKATEKDRQAWIKFANIALLMEFLPIYDNLKLAISHIPKEQKQNDWVMGVKHIKNQFGKFLADNGVEEIKTIGEKFNPELHEAVKVENGAQLTETQGEQVDRGKPAVVIKREVRPGYKLNGKVLYAAKVEV